MLVGGELDRQGAGRAVSLGLRAPGLLPAAGLGDDLEQRAAGVGQVVVSLVWDARRCERAAVVPAGARR